MSDLWANLLIAWGVQVSGLISPGPGVMFLLAVATSQGRRPALAACVGIAGGALFWSTATVIGLSALMAEVSVLLSVVKFIGAGYLGWLAWKSFRSAASPTPLVAARAKSTGLLRAVWAGFLMQISNPKAIFFWIAIASLGTTAHAPVWVPPVFIAGAVVLSFLGHAAWALGLSARPMLAAYDRARRWIDGALGTIFAVAAIKLATSRV